MTKKQKRENNSFLSKIYLIVLFITGITVGITFQTYNNYSAANKQINVKYNTETKQKSNVPVKKEQTVKQEPKTETRRENATQDNKPVNNPVVQKLENELVTVLVSNNVFQQDIIAQYAREVDGYTQYYKEIKLREYKRADTFDYQFKTLARNCKIEVSKVADENLGTYTYSFYDKNKVYSIVVFRKSDSK